MQKWISSLAVMTFGKAKSSTKWTLYDRRRRVAARLENGMASTLGYYAMRPDSHRPVGCPELFIVRTYPQKPCLALSFEVQGTL